MCETTRKFCDSFLQLFGYKELKDLEVPLKMHNQRSQESLQATYVKWNVQYVTRVGRAPKPYYSSIAD